ncbi:MAG: hypothetical protein WCT08_04875 [Patescibacteria group bacterium]|jgi:hypothetical protein
MFIKRAFGQRRLVLLILAGIVVVGLILFSHRPVGELQNGSGLLSNTFRISTGVFVLALIWTILSTGADLLAKIVAYAILYAGCVCSLYCYGLNVSFQSILKIFGGGQ